MPDWSGRDLEEEVATGWNQDPERLLDKPRIEAAFERLDREIGKARVATSGNPIVVHLAGSAPLLLDGSRQEKTRDVDALRISRADDREALNDAVERVAAEMGLDSKWLNNHVSAIPGMPPRDDGEERTVYDGRFLRVVAASDRQLLAMKFKAHRRQDWDDMEILTGRLNVQTAKQVREIHDRYFPATPYSTFPASEKRILESELPRRLAEWDLKRGR